MIVQMYCPFGGEIITDLHNLLPSFKRGVIKRLHCPFRWKDRISVKYFLLAVVAMHCPFMGKYSHVRTIPLSFYSRRWTAPAFSIYGFFSGGRRMIARLICKPPSWQLNKWTSHDAKKRNTVSSLRKSWNEPRATSWRKYRPPISALCSKEWKMPVTSLYRRNCCIRVSDSDTPTCPSHASHGAYRPRFLRSRPDPTRPTYNPSYILPGVD